MFPQFQASRRLFNRIKLANPAAVKSTGQLKQQVICKRWSGHNAMEITPSNYGWKHFKDTAHFYFLISTVPVTVIATIINIRANPELTEIPEGYEPRHWEYYKHPTTRFMAKYFFQPMEIEHELQMSLLETESECAIMKKIQTRAEKVMSFYNDHRTRYFRPFYGEYFRIGRDDSLWGINRSGTAEGNFIDYAYDPKINPVPTEGYYPTESSD